MASSPFSLGSRLDLDRGGGGLWVAEGAEADRVSGYRGVFVSFLGRARRVAVKEKEADGWAVMDGLID